MNIKAITLEKLKWIFGQVQFKRDPYWHQYLSILFTMDLDRVAFFHPVGSGKTSTAYYVMENSWKCDRILVVCPTSGFRAWGRDAEWTDYSYTYLTGKSDERKEKLYNQSNVYIVNWEGLKYTFGKRIPKNGATKWVMDRDMILDECSMFDCVVLDEVHRCKNYLSLQTKIAVELSKNTTHTIGLTGTPFDKDLLQLFNVYNVIDLGQSLGRNFWRFRLDNFHKVGFDWVPNDGVEDDIFDNAAPITLAFSKEECYDLPECQELVYEIENTDAFRKWEKLIITQSSFDIDGHTVNSDKPSQCAHLLRELSAGFLYYKDVSGTNRRYEMKVNPKLSALMDIVDDNQVKMIVFYAHRGTEDLIGKQLKKRDIGYVVMRGGQKPEERVEAERAFLQDKNVQVCLANVGCGSEAWEGHSASIVVFYDLVASPTVREQCVGRMLRRGQTKKTTVIELVIKNSIDEIIKANQGPRKDLVDSFLEYVEDYT